MDKLPNCTVCNSSYTYIDRDVYVCPECGYEWSDNDNQTTIIYDANNNILNDGDTVILIKDLKVKGSSNSLKKGTKVKNIKLRPDEEHNIDCKIEGFGAMELKSEFVKKAA